jgi:RNA polymerase-binding transcription factor DksA
MALKPARRFFFKNSPRPNNLRPLDDCWVLRSFNPNWQFINCPTAAIQMPEPTNKILSEIEKKLKEERSAVEAALSKIAIPNKNVPGDWQSKFPYGDGESGTASLERQADEVEEYATRLPLEKNMETKLMAIDAALAKIAQGTYGKCEKCGKQIPLERLNIFPEAPFCVDCQ